MPKRGCAGNYRFLTRNRHATYGHIKETCMTGPRQPILDQLFHAAAALPGDQRQAFLAENCADPEIRAELASLLAFTTSSLRLTFSETISEIAASLSAAGLTGHRVGPYRL